MTVYLVGWDGSPASDAALEWAAAQAGSGDHLHVATAVPEALQDKTFLGLILPGIDLGDLAKPETFRDSTGAKIDARCEALDTEATLESHVAIGEPTSSLFGLIESLGVEHLIVGFKSYERDLPNGVGHVAERLVRYAPCTVTVVRVDLGEEPAE